MNLQANHFGNVLKEIGWPSCNSSDPIDLVGFTSCSSGQGVSTISAKVAETMATVFKVRTLLIDCDVKGPSLHRLFNQDCAPGLADIINLPEKLDRTIQQTSIRNLHLLTAGNVDSLTLYPEESMRTMFRAALVDYDLAICDIPAIGSQSHAMSTLSLMDRVLVVVDSKKISSQQWEDHRKLMMRRGISISAIVMNRTSPIQRNCGS